MSGATNPKIGLLPPPSGRRRLGDFLRRQRMARGLDLVAMASSLDACPRFVAAVETGAAFPTARQRRAWAAALGYADLLDFDRQWRSPPAGSAQGARPAPLGFVPVINAAPAGPPVDYQEFGIDTAVGCDYVPRADTPEQQSADFLFAVVLIGDSMSPAFEEGDLVIFRPLSPDEPLTDGSAVFVRFTASRDHTCTFKRLFFASGASDHRCYELRPDNPAHQSLFVLPEEIDRLALAIERRAGYCPAPPGQPRRIPDQYAQAVERE